MARITLALCCLLLLISCDVSSPGDVAQSEIKDHLDAMKTAFALDDLDGFMSYFHPDYFHDGDTFLTVQLKWELNMMEYQNLDFENIDVDVHSPQAHVTGQLVLRDAEGTAVYYSMPEECAEFSYWQLDDGEWRLFGRQY